MTWQWMDPAAGAKKAARLLRPNSHWRSSGTSAEQARTWREHSPRSTNGSSPTPIARAPSDPLAAYEQFFITTANEIQQVGAFSEPERWQFDWEQRYTEDQWLEQVPGFGEDTSEFPPVTLDELLAGIGADRSTRSAGASRCDTPPWPSPPADNATRCKSAMLAETVDVRARIPADHFGGR